MEKMKACECGRKPTILRRQPFGGTRFMVVAGKIECTSCGQSSEWHDTVYAAIAAWNRRAGEGE